jgi:hypothetical protein
MVYNKEFKAMSSSNQITGMPERSARNVLGQLLEKGLLVSESQKSPVQIGFPTSAVGYYFPRLYPESIEASMLNEKHAKL